MKKVNVSIPYEEEKLIALRWYAQQKGVQLEEELTRTLDNLFTKLVPSSVREYITREPDDAST